MALTNFASLTDEELTIWQRDTWSAARNYSFMDKFTGTSENSMIQRITDLTKTKKGARAVITLVNDLEGDGTPGDNTLEGNEESLTSGDQVINIDQLRHANRHEGEMADQRSVVRFREQSRNKLAYWLSDRMDQMGFLTLSGVAYTQNTDGTARTGSGLPQLEFASDVVVPSTNRHFYWDGAGSALAAGATNAVELGDTPEWNMFVEVRALLRRQLVKPIRGGQGQELYNVFMSPEALKALKKDTVFQAMLRDAAQRGPANPLFKIPPVYFIDGFAIYEHNHVYHATDWGGSANVAGSALLFCGAQAMGVADIGMAKWKEKEFDYGNSPGISYGKIFGMLKPQFKAPVTKTTEDFGVTRIDVSHA